MRRFGLIGKTLKHSFSKNYFERKFAEEGIKDCSYENFELTSIEEFRAFIDSHSDLQGLNITIPYKAEIIPFLDFTNEVVREIGACNCIRISEGKLYGFNTDAIAFQESLQKRVQSFHKAALVLGSGGASKAVQYALKKLGIAYVVVSRTRKENQLSYGDVSDNTISAHQLIINTTPLGMYPDVNQLPSIPYNALTSQHLLYDLTYNPAKTKFLEEGEKRGAEILNGYEMLVAQAEESWRIWNSAQ
jgi:shikimate dehydrogenase